MGHRGLLLAAGSGTRMGKPKALMHDHDGTSWLTRTVVVLQESGCEDVTVVLGAGAEEALSLLEGTGADVVIAEDWSEGMGASLRAGLRSLAGSDDVAAVVMLVDLPDVTAEVVRQVSARVTEPGQLSINYPFPKMDLVRLDDALTYGSRAAKARFAVYIGPLG